MAERVVASGKPCDEWRELISAGRVTSTFRRGGVDVARTPPALCPQFPQASPHGSGSVVGRN